MCICIPNVKLLCLALCQAEVCTYDNADADANDEESAYCNYWLHWSRWTHSYR